MKKTQSRKPSTKPTQYHTDEIPLGLGRMRQLIWVNGAWVGANIYTAEPLMDDLGAAIDSMNLRNGSPGNPRSVEVSKMETFCICVKPYYGRMLSQRQRQRLCSDYARQIVASLEGRMLHILCEGESLFWPLKKGRKAA